MKGKTLLILAVVLLLLLTAVPVSADWEDWSNHPDHNPGDGAPGAGYNNNHPIPPNDSGHAQAPGPNGPGPLQ